MALNINDIYKESMFLLNKSQSGEVTDTDWNTAAAFVSLDIFRKQTGLPEDYMPGNPTPRVAWQITNTISDDLRLLVRTSVIQKVNGVFPYPTDYGAFSKMRYKMIMNSPLPNGNPTYEERWIESVNDDEFDLRIDSRIKPPTYFYPIFRYGTGGFEVAPQNISRIELTYLKIPATPFRNFTQLPNDQTEYNPIGSVQFEYPETMYSNIAARIAHQIGINIREEFLTATMQQRKNEGN